MRLVVVALFSLAACSSSTADTTDGGEMDASPSPPPGPAEIHLGELDDEGTFAAYEATQDAPLVWGSQGGIMITPTILLDPAEGWRADARYTVTLTHSPAEGHDDAFRIDNATYEFTTRPDSSDPTPGAILPPSLDTEGDLLGFRRIFNQLSGDVHDSWTQLEVRVESEGRVGTASATLHLLDASVRGPACDRFEPEYVGGPCQVRYVPFTAHVLSTRPGEDNYDGATTSYVRYTTSADEDVLACEPALDGDETERIFLDSVIESSGLDVGADVEMFRALAFQSSCGIGDVLPSERH